MINTAIKAVMAISDIGSKTRVAIDHARSPQNGHWMSNRFNLKRQRLHAFLDRGRAMFEALNRRSPCGII